MSRNGSYAKSMNGIVSFDDGDGTIIEGAELSTGIINCETLNASSTVNSSQLFTDFIGPNANSGISVLSNTTFNNNIYVNNIYDNASGTISLKNNTAITGTLAITSTFQTASIEGRGIGGVGSPLNIGQVNDYTSYVNIGRAAITAGGFVFPAIPVRTTYIPTSNFDICNKLYVDNATAGTNILSLNNTFTGTTNTFQNLNTTGNIVATGNVTGEIIKTRNIEALATNVRCNLFNTTETEIIVIGDGQTTGVLYLGTTPSIKGRTGNVVIGATTCNTESRGPIVANLGIKLPTATNSIDTDTVGATVSLFNSLTTGTLNIGKSITTTGLINIGPAIQVSEYGIKAQGGTSSAIELFKEVALGTVTMCSTLVLSASNYDCLGINNTIRLTEKLTTGSLRICNNLTTGGVYIADSALTTGSVNMCGSFIFKVNSLAAAVVTATIDLFKTTLSGTINFATGLTTGILNIATGQTTGTINIGNITSTTANQMGNIKMGNATNNSTAVNNGCCTINKLQVGIGTANRCVITGYTGAGLSGNQNFTIPGAPTTLGNPIVLTQMNAPMNGFIYSVSMNVTGPNTIIYRKLYQAGGSTFDASVENFFYMAIWQ